MNPLLRALAFAALVLVPSSAAAQQGLSVHGYLSQGYAQATDNAIYGIPTSGTTDYRALALQFRYAINNRDALVMQFSNRRLGQSAIQATEPDVALDWAFFQTRWQDASIRIGKVPMPRGLFNEVRDVGVLFPFFRASKAFYSEGVETVDGVVVSRGFDVGDFRLDASAFAGEFDLVAELALGNGLEVVEQELEDAYGLRGSITTPLDGIRVTGDYITSDYPTGETLDFLTVSADWTRDRWFTRYERIDSKVRDETGADDTGYVAWYAQAGVGITEKLWANVQYESNDITLYQVGTPEPFEYENIRDLGLSLQYKFSPLFLVTAEWHTNEGYQFDAGQPPLVPGLGALPPLESDYFIISIAAAF